jgi:hypothetical protein
VKVCALVTGPPFAKFVTTFGYNFVSEALD